MLFNIIIMKNTDDDRSSKRNRTNKFCITCVLAKEHMNNIEFKKKIKHKQTKKHINAYKNID